MIGNFERCLKLLLVSEGGFTDDERDSGNTLPDGRKGSTMLGVTQSNWEIFVGHKVSHADMKALTIQKVSSFYKFKYWNPCYCDALPIGLDYLLFDFGVNAGTGRSVKVFQQSIGAFPDGVIGPKTMALIKSKDQAYLIDKFSLAKEEYYRSLKSFPIFGKGWLNRITEVENLAMDMIQNG